MVKKTFSLEELENLPIEEIIDKINHEDYSLLNSIGGEKLRREMVPIGKICRVVLNYFYRPKKDHKKDKKSIKRARKKFAKTLRRIAPLKCHAKAFPKAVDEGLVIGFNHPSLGEVMRILSLKFSIYPDKTVLWPVNLPWYEALAKSYDDLEKVGIIITPTLTPSTWNKLQVPEDSPYYDVIYNLKKNLRNVYTKRSIETIKKHGMIFVAPSATRQSTVFKNKAVYNKKEDIIPTMSILAIKLYQDPEINCSFLPLAVMPPKYGNRSLNLFLKYEIIPAEPMTAEYIKKTYFKEKDIKRLDGFDYEFHLKIAEKLPKKYWY